MNLHSPDREAQNAYHEFFIVMQADEGVPFQLDWLEVGGSVKNPKWWWFDDRRSLSSAVTGLTLRQPPFSSKGGTDIPTGPKAPVEDDDPTDTNDGPTTVVIEKTTEGRACALAPGNNSTPSAWWLLAGIGMCAGLRRRDGVAS
jgi:MYXO-CTERM domain-containing protein